jgi:DNA mismatch repair ATPase MutS
MRHGKLDEELRRMSDLADIIGPRSLLLLNESFAATNEREGSQIARQIIDAVVDADIRVCAVTHLYELADGLCRDRSDALFLRADRQTDPANRFTLRPGRPESTSFADDVYQQVFATAPAAATRIDGST